MIVLNCEDYDTEEHYLHRPVGEDGTRRRRSAGLEVMRLGLCSQLCHSLAALPGDGHIHLWA